MDSSSLAKSSEMPAVGALYPRHFAERGYWWWKAQEINYALRPRVSTIDAFERKYGKMLSGAVFQIRRTDKTKGCDAVYGVLSFHFYNLTNTSCIFSDLLKAKTSV